LLLTVRINNLKFTVAIMTKYILYTSLLMFVMGFAIIVYFYETQKPIKLKDLREYVGETVLIEGNVVEVDKTKSGRIKLKITDNTSTAWLIIPVNKSCKRVIAVGRVSEFMGDYYIFVYREKDILLCKT